MAIERAPALTVYSRNSCHLCDEMIAGLRQLQAHRRFDLAVVDVDGDPELARRYGDDVPVLAHGNRVLCRHALDTVAVTAYLANFR